MKYLYAWCCLMVGVMPVLFYVYVPYTPPPVDIQVVTEEYKIRQAIADRNLLLFLRGYESHIDEEDLVYGSYDLVIQVEEKLD